MSDHELGVLARDIVEYCEKEREAPGPVRTSMVMHMIKTSLAKQLGAAMVRTLWPGR